MADINPIGVDRTTGQTRGVGASDTLTDEAGSGIAGLQGSTGLVGLVGNTGTGTQGVTGSLSISGVTGAIGIAGITGIQGITGILGLTGLNVAGTGLQGITGLALQGITGLGIQGSTGTQGMISVISLSAQTSTSTSSPTSETTLLSYTLPADELDTDGDQLLISFNARNIVGSGGTVVLKVYFGSTVMATSTEAFSGGTTISSFEIRVGRTAAATQWAHSNMVRGVSGSAIDTKISTRTAPTETLSGTVLIKATGIITTGAPDPTIAAELFTVSRIAL